MNRFSRCFKLVLLASLLLLGACSIKSDAERAEDTRLRMQKLGNAFLVHYAYAEARAKSVEEVVQMLLADDPEPLAEDVVQKVANNFSHDAWGRPLAFEYFEPPGALRVRLVSNGPDGVAGTADDITLEQTIIELPE